MRKRTLIAPDGRKVVCVPFNTGRMTGYQVEVKEGRVVKDAFFLYDDAALDYTAKRRGWR